MSGRIYNRKNQKKIFICQNCNMEVSPLLGGGNHRNHCPNCLWSLHVDMGKGDRSCECRGKMEPISVWVKPSKEWSLIHRCQSCGFIRANRIAGDDNEQLLFMMAASPLTMLPFPVVNSLTGV